MNTLEPCPQATDVSIRGEELNVLLADGRKISVPLSWFPLLLQATPTQRQNFELLGGGQGIHWPDIDEDLSIAGLLAGLRPAQVTMVRFPRKTPKGASGHIAFKDFGSLPDISSFTKERFTFSPSLTAGSLKTRVSSTFLGIIASAAEFVEPKDTKWGTTIPVGLPFPQSRTYGILCGLNPQNGQEIATQTWPNVVGGRE
jgi:hypothetical protein